MRRLAHALLLALAACPAAAEAQRVVTSPGPGHVAVTVYRDPNRGPGDAFNLNWLNGYALISETRQITLEPGESEIRFEGVAGGIIPQSAIVTGLPEGLIERNRDAYLLSPATLLDRSLGRRVTIRRTSRATGAVRETEAIIRSSANGAVVLQTADGFESLRCTGLNETLIYDSVPQGLSARPTLSVRARSSGSVTATVTLSYLASGFDWQANYIANLDEDGRHLQLFAWLTLASNDETSFPDADAAAVAGRLNREPIRIQPREGGPLNLQCWPQGTTSDILNSLPPPPAPLSADFAGEAITVTGSRVRRANLQSAAPVTVVNAELEALGDVKLYRIPEPVTVAANGQKQVALLHRDSVEADLVYRRHVGFFDGSDAEPQPATLVLVTRNRERQGLGLPLPAGQMVLFAAGEGRPILLGQGTVEDLAVGQDVDIELGEMGGVRTELTSVERGKGRRDYVLLVTNDHSAAVRFEAEFADSGPSFRPSSRLGRRNGHPLWTVTVPANGNVSLRYRLIMPEEE
ncbi:MAG: hypothetical protein E6G92_13100 [Alphaproteobacteria bacterium]|nr:MAG: hypothetical protein E6G92_13100 [Alphaproteobacteria bacterium]